MMYLDVKFFKNLVRMLETDHNMVRGNDEVTESWKFHVDQTIIQCKEMIRTAEYQEERESVFTQFDEIVTRLDALGWYPVFRSETFIDIEDIADEDQDG